MKCKILFPIIILLILTLISCDNASKFDLVILNGKIIAGDGNPWYMADIGIKKEKITFIGDIKDSGAAKTIDAAGLYISPGFIDIHSHSDRNIVKIATADNYLLQGVTTTVGGNCGGHRYPIADQFDKIKKQGIAINYCSLLGHNTIRREVMGLKADDPTREELDQMKALIRQEMEAGAIGMSTGLGYMPGRYSKTDEIIELASVLTEFNGLYASHIRNQGTEFVEAIEEAIRIGEENDIPVQIAHIKLCIESNWGRLEMIDKPIREARARGVDVTTDQYPYIATSSGFSSSFPAWSLEGGREELKKRLEDQDNYRKIKAHIIAGRLTSEKGINKLQSIFICNCKENPDYQGKNLEEILIEKGKKPTVSNGADLIIEIETSGGASCVFFQMIEDDIDDIMNLDYNMIGSDGGIIEYGNGVPHCRSYGTFPRVIDKYVKEKKALSLEKAIRKMTSLPAQVLRLADRGLVKKDMFADLVIFDLNTIKDTATFQRPHQYPEGVEYVIVNGTVAAEKGKPTGALPGKPLYGNGID